MSRRRGSVWARRSCGSRRRWCARRTRRSSRDDSRRPRSHTPPVMNSVARSSRSATVSTWCPGPALGAGDVTLVGRGERLARVHDLADRVVDVKDVDALKASADLVVEFAGTADAARQAIATARRGGRVVLGGATGTGTELSGVDLSTIVRGNLDVLGSLANPKGVSGRALTLLARGVIDVDRLVTHHFPLERFGEAWRTFTEREGGAIRVMLHPSPERPE